MNIEQTLLEFIRGELLDAGQALGPEDALLEDGLVDSLGVMRLVAFIGERFAVEVPPEDVVLENFASVRDMSRYLASRGV